MQIHVNTKMLHYGFLHLKPKQIWTEVNFFFLTRGTSIENRVNLTTNIISTNASKLFNIPVSIEWFITNPRGING